MKSVFRPAAILAALMSLTACGTAIRGGHQVVEVKSNIPNAFCELSNEKGSWSIFNTPSHVSLARSNSDLTVVCRTSLGAKGQVVVPASLEAASSILGNAALGGASAVGLASMPIAPALAASGAGVAAGGALIDGYSGAAFHYPPVIEVTLTPAEPEVADIPVRPLSKKAIQAPVLEVRK